MKAIVTMDGDLDVADAGRSVTVTLEDEIDVSRGDVLAAANQPPEAADQFRATVFWMAEQPMYAGRPYLMKIGTNVATAQITDVRHTINVNTGEELAAKTLELNEIGVVNISLSRDVVFEPYAENPALGAFILVDKMSNGTVGMGMIDYALRRAANIHTQALDVTKTARADAKGQKPAVLWFTGLSGSGKSTIANIVEKRLHAMGRHTYILDGDNVRHGLNRDLGFTDATGSKTSAAFPKSPS